MSFIEENCRRQGLAREFTSVDTVELARFLLPHLHNAKLDTVAKALNGSLENHHRAVDDAGCTAEIFVKFLDMLKGQGTEDLNGVNRLCKPSVDQIKRLRSCHHSGAERYGPDESLPAGIDVTSEIFQRWKIQPSLHPEERVSQTPGRLTHRFRLRGRRAL